MREDAIEAALAAWHRRDLDGLNDRPAMLRSVLAFLAAVEEPSEGMCDAGDAAFELIEDWEYVMQVRTETIWAAMLKKLRAELMDGK